MSSQRLSSGVPRWWWAILGGAILVGLAVAWLLRDSGTGRNHSQFARSGDREEIGSAAGPDHQTVRAPQGAAGTPPDLSAAALAEDVPGVIVDQGPFSTDPRDATYDASRSMFERFHGYADALWAAEPVNNPWADHRAKEMLDYAEHDIHDLDPEAKVVIECRTATCRVRMFSKNPLLVDELGPYPFSCMAKFGMFGDSGTTEDGSYTDFFFVYHPWGVTEAGFAAYRDKYCPHEREKWLEDIKHPL